MPIAAIFVVVVAGRFLLRPVLRIVAANPRVQEAFTAAALLVVVGTALLFESAGLSMALGAFIAGVLLADSESTSSKPTSSRSRACCWDCSSSPSA